MAPSPSSSIVQEILERSCKLPPFPDIVWKVMPLVRDMAPVHQIEAIIKYDPAITAKILSFSQGAQYARRPASIRSLRDAIMVVGQQQLIHLIMTACASHYFEGDSPGYELEEGAAWEHAVATALMAEILARHLGWKETLTAYTAALLHDIGKTVLSLYAQEYFAAILGLIQDRRMSFLDAEREVFGIDHQQLGTLIARRWRLPEEVAIAIGFHHCPTQAGEHHKLASLIYVANRLVSAMGIGCGVDGFLHPNEDGVFVDLGIRSRDSERLLVALIEAFQGAKQFLTS